MTTASMPTGQYLLGSSLVTDDGSFSWATRTRADLIYVMETAVLLRPDLELDIMPIVVKTMSAGTSDQLEAIRPDLRDLLSSREVGQSE